jgi:hypothetical protein
LPWEETEQFIRSGHRNPDDFQTDSMRTIWMSEKDGVKAVVGKRKGKDSMEVVSYLFIKEKGWTVDKAKQWFEKHKDKENVTLKEHFSAVLPLTILEKIVDKPLHIRGIAATTGMSRNFNIYTPESLQALADNLVSAPLYVEHVAVPNAIGKVTKTEWDGKNLWYEAEIYDDEVAEKIRKGLIQHVSVGADYETLEIVDGRIPHGLHNAELSLVAVPGIAETNIQVMEKLRSKSIREQQTEESQELIIQVLRDYSAFVPEHFRLVWVDKIGGVQGIFGLQRETQGEPQPYALLFYKSQGWTPQRVDDWLTNHAQYRPDLSASQVSTTSQNPSAPFEVLQESLIKSPSERMVPVKHVTAKLQSIIPPDFILRSWPGGSGGYRLAQELKRTIREFEGGESSVDGRGSEMNRNAQKP